ncbi:MAG: tRNA (adenosine(37)-N6)-threonylcarbamoyltransferase complex transferase subunit TsaD [Gammaproteobacteria bacterium]|nr:tRNA (adenosine(37)-N6)-threonylcarbamoyltransferase complex transferase subunit TsaD [Gammaproteobacteria bacterium]
MRVLGLETSCDETAVALYDTEQGLVAHCLNSQIALHAPYGGVVPEIASRDHIRKIIPLLKNTLREANLKKTDIEGIAYTAGPGLIGALLVGATFGKALGLALNIPTIAVHHMEAHLLAPLLETRKPSFPFLALLVSGGHTLLVRVQAFGSYTILGGSRDDAVGEAFDKTAQLLGLGLPGGSELEKLALQGNPHRFSFPRPMLKRPGLDFSFSGLKTAVSRKVSEEGKDSQTKADIARAFQDAVIDILVKKCHRALLATKLTTLVVGGGVAANQSLRSRLFTLMEKWGGELFFPKLEYCTDNAAMIAYTGALKLINGQRDDHSEIRVYPRWDL